MINKRLLAFSFVLGSIISCSVVDSYFEDNFNDPGPPPLSFRQNYPAVAEFTVIQEIPTTINVPPDSFLNSVIITKYPPAANQPLRFFTRIYKKGSQLSEDVLLFQLIDTPDDSDTVSLGGSVRSPLDQTEIESVRLCGSTDKAIEVRHKRPVMMSRNVGDKWPPLHSTPPPGANK